MLCVHAYVLFSPLFRQLCWHCCSDIITVIYFYSSSIIPVQDRIFQNISQQEGESWRDNLRIIPTPSLLLPD